MGKILDLHGYFSKFIDSRKKIFTNILSTKQSIATTASRFINDKINLQLQPYFGLLAWQVRLLKDLTITWLTERNNWPIKQQVLFTVTITVPSPSIRTQVFRWLFSCFESKIEDVIEIKMKLISWNRGLLVLISNSNKIMSEKLSFLD